jgi:hypothetical protein
MRRLQFRTRPYNRATSMSVPAARRKIDSANAAASVSRVALALLAAGLLGIAPARSRAASLLPLDAEEAATLPSGSAEVVLGAQYSRNERFPAFTPAGVILHQNLVRGPQIALRIAAGSWAEVQAQFEMIHLDEETSDGNSRDKYGAGDARLHTKVRILRERGWRPAFGVRFGTKLPNANRNDRLGTDETDFDIAALASKDFGPLAAHVNLGLSLLGNPGPELGATTRSGGGQDDLFTYDVALTSHALATGGWSFRLLGEVVGQTGSRGDFGNDRTAARLGVQTSRGGLTAYLGSSIGLVTASENYGFSGGLIYAFELERLFGRDD